MYNILKRQCAHLSPILSGDGASSSSSSSSSSSPTNYIPPPNSAVVSSSNSMNNDDLDVYDKDTLEMVNWKNPICFQKEARKKPSSSKIKGTARKEKYEIDSNDQTPPKFRKITHSNQANAQYARVEKKSVRFRDENEKRYFPSTTTLHCASTCNETESSFWSDSAASYGFSKYLYPQRTSLRLPVPPPPSPNSKSAPEGQRSGLNFPRTNPFATLPRQLSSHYPTKGASIRPVSESSASTTTTTTTTFTSTSTSTSGDSRTTDSIWMRYDRRYSQSDSKSIFSSTMANAQRRRILAGLKSFGIKGELLISILLNRGLITITIDEARNLVSPCASGCCSTYVRLSLMPDEEKRTQCKTELIPFTNRPIFHQTFTVELLPEDYEKRLVISMWHKERANEKSILMGCMAFTIRHMVESNKVIDGWYFLLAPEYGRKKHLAVHKVNMVTYYGPVDRESENENQDGSQKSKSRWTDKDIFE